MDASDAVATELGARAARVRAVVGGGLAAGGLLIGALGYVALRGYFLDHVGMSSPVAVATLTVLPALAGALALHRPLAERALTLLKPRWIVELAARYGLEPGHVEELAAILGPGEDRTRS